MSGGNWLDQPLEGRELKEYAISRLGADWEVRNGQLVGHAQGAGERAQRVEPNVLPRRSRRRGRRSS